MVKRVILTSLFFILVTALFGLFNTPALAQSCTTTGGYPGTCVLETECNESNLNITWDESVCPHTAALFDLGCCGVKPGAPENSRPSLGESCNSTKGWPGACTKNINCNQSLPHITYDITTCKAGGCCGEDPNGPGSAPCTTTEGWKGNCTEQSDCIWGSKYVVWDPKDPTCPKLNHPNYGKPGQKTYGCCGTDPKNCIADNLCKTAGKPCCNGSPQNVSVDVCPSGQACGTTGTATKTCDFVSDTNQRAECVKCAADNNGIWTAIGCITTDPNNLLGTILRLGLGLAGGIAFLLILFGGLQIMTSAGNPEQLNAGRELITSAIVGLILILFSIFLLQFIGINIIGIPEFISK